MLCFFKGIPLWTKFGIWVFLSSSGYFWVTSHKTPGISEGFGVRNSFFRLVTYLLPMVDRWIIVWNIVWKKNTLNRSCPTPNFWAVFCGVKFWHRARTISIRNTPVNEINARVGKGKRPYCLRFSNILYKRTVFKLRHAGHKE